MCDDERVVALAHSESIALNQALLFIQVPIQLSLERLGPQNKRAESSAAPTLQQHCAGDLALVKKEDLLSGPGARRGDASES